MKLKVKGRELESFQNIQQLLLILVLYYYYSISTDIVCDSDTCVFMLTFLHQCFKYLVCTCTRVCTVCLCMLMYVWISRKGLLRNTAFSRPSTIHHIVDSIILRSSTLTRSCKKHIP